MGETKLLTGGGLLSTPTFNSCGLDDATRPSEVPTLMSMLTSEVTVLDSENSRLIVKVRVEDEPLPCTATEPRSKNTLFLKYYVYELASLT